MEALPSTQTALDLGLQTVERIGGAFSAGAADNLEPPHPGGEDHTAWLAHDVAERAARRVRSQYRGGVLVEPAQSLTDLALGLVTVALAVQMRRFPPSLAHWRTAFWWFAVAALAGAVHHGAVVRWPQAADVSWTLISVTVVVAVSYLLAATVVEVLGPDRGRIFWLLRSVGVLAYVAMAASGRAGIGTILVCEGLTMLSVLGLWLFAAYRHHPRAQPTLLAIGASLAAAAFKLLDSDVLWHGLDPTSAYHLAQIAGIVLLYVAISGYTGAGADEWGDGLRREAAGAR